MDTKPSANAADERVVEVGLMFISRSVDELPNGMHLDPRVATTWIAHQRPLAPFAHSICFDIEQSRQVASPRPTGQSTATVPL